MVAARPCQGDPQLAGPVRDVLERPMRSKGMSCASGRDAPWHILGVLLEVRRGTLDLFAFELPEVDGGSRRRCGRRSLIPRRRPVGLAGGEDEQRRDPEKNRAGDDQNRPRRAGVERAIEQGAKPVDHQRPSSPSMLGGWAKP
jgi:hypothetical protein